MEPLTFKGREGSGHAGGRCAYADKTLDPGIDDWKKFAPSYRLWGRHLYNPDATPEALEDAHRWIHFLLLFDFTAIIAGLWMFEPLCATE